MKIAATLAIDQSHRPHRSIGERIEATAGDLLDGQTCLKIARLLERMEGDYRGMGERLMEAQVFLLGERAIEVIPASPSP